MVLGWNVRECSFKFTFTVIAFLTNWELAEVSYWTSVELQPGVSQARQIHNTSKRITLPSTNSSCEWGFSNWQMIFNTLHIAKIVCLKISQLFTQNECLHSCRVAVVLTALTFLRIADIAIVLACNLSTRSTQESRILTTSLITDC